MCTAKAPFKSPMTVPFVIEAQWIRTGLVLWPKLLTPTLLHEPRELSPLLRAMQIVWPLKQSDCTGLYC